MEGTIRKTIPAKNASIHRRRSKPVYNYRILKKIFRQLIFSSLILITVLTVRNIDTPFTKTISLHINGFLNNNLDFSKMYESTNIFAVKAQDTIRSLFKPVLKTQVPSDSSISQKDTKDVPAEKLKKESQANNTDVNTAVIAAPVISSINLSEQDAKAIKASFKKFPMPVNGPISSGFGLRINPITKKEEFHPGIDIKANMGTLIYAPIAGTVLESRKGTTFGNFIRIKSGKDIVTVYAHCNKLMVKKGQKISAGQKIAEVGNTGMSLGAHLHFEIWKSETPIDPSVVFKQYK